MKGEKGVSFRTTYLPGERVGRNTSFGIDPGMGVPVAAYGDGDAIDIDLKEAFQGRLMRNSDHLLWLAAGVCPCGYELQLGEFAHPVVLVIGESAGGVQSLPAAKVSSVARESRGSVGGGPGCQLRGGGAHPSRLSHGGAPTFSRHRRGADDSEEDDAAVAGGDR